MPLGISNTTTITQDMLLNMTNASGFSEFAINVNHDIYSGWLYFILLWVLWVIVLAVGQQVRNQPLNNMLYGGIFVTLVSIFLRAVTMTQDGVVRGMLTDFQMYIFPLITILLGLILYATKD